MTPLTRLADVAQRLGRLRPDWSNPERYFEERSEIERTLRVLIREIEKGGRHG